MGLGSYTPPPAPSSLHPHLPSLTLFLSLSLSKCGSVCVALFFCSDEYISMTEYA